MTPLEQEIRKQIAAEGPMGFDQWMEQALYHPQHGFYSSGGQAGRRGKDFLTSPEIGPLFGAVLAKAIDGCWNELGQPDPFIVIEAGAGRGALAASVLRAKPACFEALRYVMVERSELLRAQQQETLKGVISGEAFASAEILGAGGAASEKAAVEGAITEKAFSENRDSKIFSLAKLPESVPNSDWSNSESSESALSRNKPFVPFGMVIANELLDNLPFRILERTASGWEEVVVGLSQNGEIASNATERASADSVHASQERVSHSPSANPQQRSQIKNDPQPIFLHAEISTGDSQLAASLAPNAPVGARIPLQEQASAWVRQACELIGRGRVIVFDYGATTAELAELDGWLRTYAKHGKGTSPLACPGQQDITSDVAFDQLPPPASLQTQADFLQDWGIQSLVTKAQKEWQSQAANPTTEALIARSRPTEAQTLCDPTTFGNYKAAQWIIG